MTSLSIERRQASSGSRKSHSAAEPVGLYPAKARLCIALLLVLGACLDRKGGNSTPSTSTAAVDAGGGQGGQGGMSGQGGVIDVPLLTGTGGTVPASQDGSLDIPQTTGSGGVILVGQGGAGGDLPQGTGTGGAILVGQGGIGSGGAVGQGGSTTSDAPVEKTPALPVGAACQTSGECSLGNCIDGFCCDSACTGCSACSNALTGKTNGTCAPVQSGQDPHSTCADETASSQCGNDGTCDGSGACRKVGTSHICTPASCSSDGKTFTPATTCDGKGTCTTATPQSCGAFQCATTGCLKTCAAQTDCGAGNYCNIGAGTCAAKKQNGQPATESHECTSGIVAGGVCCNASCGECNACSTGTCTPVANGTGCGSGRVCSGGNCQAGCWIGGGSGSFFASNTVNTSNNCQVCAPAKSTTTWSNNDGAQVPCGTCGGTASCANQTQGPCSKTPSTFYLDGDSDGYGNAAVSVSACSKPTGYVENSSDCNDGSGTIKPGYAVCSGNDRSYCDGTGPTKTEVCPDGCYGGTCRNDGTIGKAGWVSCGVGTGPLTTRCLASEGCGGGECNKTWGTHCDGPNDCKAGEKCCGAHDRGGSFESVCSTQECATLNKNTICDPLVPNDCPAFCRPGLIEGGYWSCQSS